MTVVHPNNEVHERLSTKLTLDAKAINGNNMGPLPVSTTETIRTNRHAGVQQRAHRAFAPRPITAVSAVASKKNTASSILPKMSTEERRPITAMPKIGHNDNHMPKVPLLNNFMVKDNSVSRKGSSRYMKRVRSRTSSTQSDMESARRSSSLSDRPRRTSNILSDRKSRRIAASDGSASDTNETLVYDPHQAWHAFVKYIQSIHTAPTFLHDPSDKIREEQGNDYDLVKDCKTSACFRKTFDEFKKKRAQKSRLTNLRNLVTTHKVIDLKNGPVETEGETETDSEVDSLDELDETHTKTMNYGKIGWSIIRNYVRERIMERKESNKGGFSWKVLRQQLLAMTNMERHRQDLYTRYGIIPPVGSRVAKSSMLVEVSSEAKDVLDKYKIVIPSLTNAKQAR